MPDLSTVNKNPDATKGTKYEKKSLKDKLFASGDELKEQLNEQGGKNIENKENQSIRANPTVNLIDNVLGNESGLNAKSNEALTNVVSEENPLSTSMKGALQKNQDEIEQPINEEVTSDISPANAENIVSENIQSETQVPEDFYQKYVDQYYGPKSGADYLKSLWSQGAGGKMAAIGNVLGNLMGAAGKGALGQDYQTDWAKYKENYIQSQAERNQRAFNDNMDIVKQIRQNDVVRDELEKTMNKMKELGKISAQDFEAIKKGMAATGKSSQMDYYLASILGNLASDKDFAEALKGLGEESINLLSGLAGFVGNTVGGVNRFMGGRK